MKVALCIAGQMRGYLEAYPSVKKHIIDVFDPDIFIHTWDDLGSSNNLHRRTLPFPMAHYLPNKLVHDKPYFSSLFTNFAAELDSQSKISETELRNIYEPKSCVVEKSPSLEESDDFFGFTVPKKMIERQPKSIWSRNLYYKIYECNKLKTDFEKKNNFKYDLVIRLRPDLSIGEIISNKIENNTLYFRYNTIDTSYQVSDQYFYADSSTMDKVCNIYKHIENIWAEYNDYGVHHKYYWAEGLLYRYLKKNHPEITLTPYRTEELGDKSAFKLIDAAMPKKSYQSLKDLLIKDINNLKESALKITFKKALSRALAENIKREKNFFLCSHLINEFETNLDYEAFYAKSILASRYDASIAIENARKALHQEDSDEVNFHLGKLLYDQKNYIEAKTYLQKSVQLQDEYNRENYLSKWQRHQTLGLVEEALGHHSEALYCFIRTISLNEKSASSFYRAGKMLYKLSMFSEALFYLNQALKLNPKHDSSAYFKCLCYCEIGLYGNTIAQCNMWIKNKESLTPSEYKFLGPLAMATFQKGQREEALLYIENYIEEQHYHEEVVINFIQTLAICNKKDSAKKLLQISLKKFPHLKGELKTFKVALK